MLAQLVQLGTAMRFSLASRIPFIGTVKSYRREDAPADLIAGLTTAVMLVPQAMAYAMLAGLPPVIGLYAAGVPLMIYALLGTSRPLAVGPVAMDSLLVASGVALLAPVGSAQFITYAILLAGVVGTIQIALGLLRAGFLINFLSHPVISGFTSAAAIVIGLSQLKHLLGVDIPRSPYVHRVISAAVSRLGQVNMATLALGVGSVALLLALRKWKPMFPRALAVVALGSLAVWGFGLEASGVSIVGDVPAGLPRPALPLLDWGVVVELLPIAITIALVGFMEAISVAKAFARRDRYTVDPNQELIAIGAANIGASVFGGYPVTGGFSRTAVNAQAGARTTVASLVTAGFVALTCVTFTPLFFYLPNAVLAAIIMTAVFGLVDVAEVRHLWAVKRSDLALLAATFVGTLALGIAQGIGIGVAASLLWFVVRKTRPHTAVLGQLPGTDVYRNIARHSEAKTFPGTLIVRMDATFYFGNVSFLKQTLQRLEESADEPVRTIILDASSINELDSSADSAFHELLDVYTERGVKFVLSGVKGPVMDVLERSRFTQALGAHGFFDTVHEAVKSLGLNLPLRGGDSGVQRSDELRAVG